MRFLIPSSVVLLPFWIAVAGRAQSPGDGWIDRLADAKEAELHALAAQLDLEVHSVFTNCFEPARARDWRQFLARKTAMNEELTGWAGREGGTIERTALWAGPVIEFTETIGMLHPDASRREASHMSPSNAIAFGREVLACLPEGAIYFGGTDGGRFLPQSAFDLRPRKGVSIITQNALADPNYMKVVRARFGETMSVPTTQDVSRAFQTFDDDATIGRYVPSGKRKRVGGRMQVEGVQNVMYINGLLVRQVIESNPNRPVFVEESYQIKWMAPHLVPHEMILRFNREPKRLTRAEAEAAIAYWEKRIPEILATSEPEGAAYRRLWSKLCAGQAGVVAHHGHREEALRLFDLGLRIFPESTEGITRKLAFLFDIKQYERALEVLDEVKEHFTFNQEQWRRSAEALLRIQKMVDDFHASVSRLPGGVESAPADKLKSMILPLLNLNDDERLNQYLFAILNQPAGISLFPEIFKDIEIFNRPTSRCTARMRRAVDMYRQRDPSSVDAAFYNAIVALRENDREAAWTAVEETLRLGKGAPETEARLRAESATRLRPLFSEVGRFDQLVRRNNEALLRRNALPSEPDR